METAGDKEDLVYAWDSSHLDTDLDGQKTGDIDFTGPTWTVEDLPAGTWTFTLTVTDDDGESTQAEIIVLVAEAPAEGILESITSTVGTTTAVIIGLLGIIIVGLVIFLLFTGKEPHQPKTTACLTRVNTQPPRRWHRSLRRNQQHLRKPSKRPPATVAVSNGNGTAVNTGPDSSNRASRGMDDGAVELLRRAMVGCQSACSRACSTHSFTNSTNTCLSRVAIVA